MLERLFPQQADDKLFVEDCFSCFLYTGNGETQTITNGIDLAGKGGLVWIKGRTNLSSGTPSLHLLTDTNRGAGYTLQSHLTAAQFFNSSIIPSFTSSGFNIGGEGHANGNSIPFVSWTFRKAAKFFDVVTYTGNGGSSQTIAHNLGIAPGMILVKRLSSGSASWQVYHRSLGSTKALYLNLTNAESTWIGAWNNTDPTATNFTVGTGTESNENGIGYVAYLFAHVPGSDGIIQCGSFDGAANTNITLGWEPQWIMFKNTTGASNWQIVDNMRGMPVGSDDRQLMPNLSNAESDNGLTTITATGFTWLPSAAGNTHIYIAIRRGPMRTPTLGTSVFSPDFFGGGTVYYNSGFPTDLALTATRAGDTYNTSVADRLRGGNNTLVTSNTNAQLADPANYFDNMVGYGPPYTGGTSTATIGWLFRRAPGFMDVVCYTGTSNFPQSYNHNLGVAPEMIIVKCRNSTTDGDASTAANWWVGVKGPQSSGANSGYVFSPGLNTTNAVLANDTWGSSVQTATSFVPWYVTLRSGGEGITGQVVGKTYVAYLFASVPGVSKVGSYTGNGSSQTINCAFTTGARFILIKRTDSTGDWYVWDSARGIVAGNDPYLALNTTAAEVASNDSVDPDSTGFVVNQVAASNINVNGGTYIFLSIA